MQVTACFLGGRDELVKSYARHADELLGDDVIGAKEEGCGAALGKHRPTDEGRAVIRLVDS